MSGLCVSYIKLKYRYKEKVTKMAYVLANFTNYLIIIMRQFSKWESLDFHYHERAMAANLAIF